MPPGGSIDFVIHNMGFKLELMHVYYPCPDIGGGNWGDDLNKCWDLILTNEITVTHTGVLPIFFSGKKLSYF